jgi:hypothetical protein
VGDGLTGAGDLSQDKLRDTTRMYVGIWGKHMCVDVWEKALRASLQ